MELPSVTSTQQSEAAIEECGRPQKFVDDSDDDEA